MQRVEKLVYKLVDQLEKKNSPQTLLFTAQLLVLELLKQPFLLDEELSTLLESNKVTITEEKLLSIKKATENSKEFKVVDSLTNAETKENIENDLAPAPSSKIEIEEESALTDLTQLPTEKVNDHNGAITNTFLPDIDKPIEIESESGPETTNVITTTETSINEPSEEQDETENTILAVEDNIIEQEPSFPAENNEIDFSEKATIEQSPKQEETQTSEEKITFDPYVFVYSDEEETVVPVFNTPTTNPDSQTVLNNSDSPTSQTKLEDSVEKTINDENQNNIPLKIDVSEDEDWFALNNIHFFEKKSQDVSRFTQNIQEVPLYPSEPTIQVPTPIIDDLLNFEPYQDFSEKTQIPDVDNNTDTKNLESPSKSMELGEAVTFEPYLDISPAESVETKDKEEEKSVPIDLQETVKEATLPPFQPFVDYMPKEFKNNNNQKGETARGTTPFLDDSFIKSPSFFSAFTNQSPNNPTTQKQDIFESSIHEKISKLETQDLNEKRSFLDDKKEGTKEVVELLRETPVKDLRKAFGINDRYLFTNGLFNGDDRIFDKSIKTINSFSQLSEAEEWMNLELVKKYGWDIKSETVKHFYQLVRRRFS